MNTKKDSTGKAASTCSQCGGPTIPIAYGFPGPELSDAAERGEVELGGCLVFPEQRRCLTCGAGLTDDRSDHG